MAEAGFDVGARLRALREMHGLSQRELAKRAGVTNAIISLIEQNRTSPSVGSLKKVLDGLPISLADFFAGERGRGRRSSSRADGARRAGRREHLLPPGRPRPDRACDADPARALRGRGRIPARPCCAMSRRRAASCCAASSRSRSAISAACSAPGTPIYFDSRLPHRFRNPGEEECEVVTACTPPSF